MKKAIALYGAADAGKTETIKLVFDLLKKEFPNFNYVDETLNLDNGDLRTVIKINGIIIGLESQGDPKSRIFISIDIFIKIHVDIIICATRTRGATVKAVEKLAAEGFEIVWVPKEKGSDETNEQNTAENLEVAKKIVNQIRPLIQQN